VNLNTPHLAISLKSSFTVCTGKQRSVSDVSPLITAAYTTQVSYKQKYGSLADVYDAMQTVIAWNTIWVPYEGLVTPVSRGWDFGSGYVIFDWDNYFLSYMASLDNKEIAYSNVIQISKSKTFAGFVPNFSSGLRKSEDRTEPPVGCKVVSEIYKKYKEKWLVEVVFDDLMGWNNWFWNYRRLAPLNLICLGSDPNPPTWNDGSVNTLQGARYESGLDNSPMYDSPPDAFDTNTHRMLLYEVGMSAMYAMDTEALADLATAIGRTAEATVLRDRLTQMNGLINTHLWDSGSGIYVNKLSTTGQFYKRLSPTLFYPMNSGAASPAQVAAMMLHLTNESEFCVHQTGKTYTCQYAVPSIARNDPSFHDNNYWRGRIWGPQVQLVYWGLQRYHDPAVDDARKNLCAQSQALLLKTWYSDGHVHENYNGDNGEGNDSGNSDPFYHWGALTGFIGLIEAGYYY